MLQNKLTNVSLKLKDYVKVENLKLAFTRTETNVIFQDSMMEFIKNNVNKGLAVLEVAQKLNINLKDVLVAGNAINDVEMLDIDAGMKVLVSNYEVRKNILAYISDPNSVKSVETPEELGKLLQSL